MTNHSPAINHKTNHSPSIFSGQHVRAALMFSDVLTRQFRGSGAIGRLLRLTGVLTAFLFMSPAPVAEAFPVEVYAPNSVLASGDWVKVSVPSTGLYRLTTQTLRRWGFSDPAKVKVYGYGGRRMADQLTADNYRDDLQPVATRADASGVVFYAVGPETVSESAQGYKSHTCNIYSSYGYYFITSNDDEGAGVTAGKTGNASTTGNATATFSDFVQYEKELTAPGQCGPQMMGEDFRYTPSRKFQFNLPDITEGSEVKLECHFAAKTYNYASEVRFTANGNAVEPNTSNRIAYTPSSSDMWAKSSFVRNTFTSSGEKVDVGIEFLASSVVYGAWLDYLSLTYERHLRLPSDGALCFSSNAPELSLGGIKGGDNGLTLWDVTDPTAALEVDFALSGENAEWTRTASGERQYAAWMPTARLPEPTLAGTVPNQNLHATGPVDMVIFAPTGYIKECNRIATMHSEGPDAMTVLVVDPEKVYNEFSSGAPDICGLRNFLKMLYDKGQAAGKPLKYALLAARATYDNRRVASESQRNRFPTLPAWYDSRRQTSLDPTDSFGTDDFLAMLDDNSGRDLTRDNLRIAVGRLPVTSVTALKNYIDKLADYTSGAKRTPWKNRIMLLADDEEGGTFVDDMEHFSTSLGDNASDQFVFQKVYIDAYRFTNGVYPEGRKEMFRNLNEGVAWWIFAGHANDHSMTAEGQFTFDDINNNMYLRNVPFLLAVTCNFLKWDANNESAGEILFNQRYGGVIGVISATRAAYITYNGYLSTAFARYLDNRDSSGRLIPAGEVYRRAKNDIRDEQGNRVYNANRLRYVFMGDPAMRTATPDQKISLTSIAGQPVDGETKPNISGRQQVTMTGSVLDLEGMTDATFNGTVTIDIYDAEKSVTTLGRGEGKEQTFQAHGDKLFSGSAPVKDGVFTLNASMPEEIADNYRPALINLYAHTDEKTPREAISVFSDLYITGMDDHAPTDTEAPKIEYLVLNHETFTSGNTVNTSPMVLARISDNVGINVSTAGVGRAMSLLIDGKKSLNDVAFYYTPSPDGSISGTVAYPLSALTEGPHSLRLRVWDTSGNMSESEVAFNAIEGLAPEVFEVYADENPASVQTNFYLRHNQPDCTATVTVTVYNLLGRPVWTATQKGRSDMFLTTPVNWNLCDSAGRRVPRGIYVYSATVTTDGVTHRTASHKIAVTSR